VENFGGQAPGLAAFLYLEAGMTRKIVSLSVHRNERLAQQSAKIVRVLESSVKRVTTRPDVGGYALVVFYADERQKCTGTVADWWDPENLFGPGMIPEAAYRALERQENTDDVKRDFFGEDASPPDDDAS